MRANELAKQIVRFVLSCFASFRKVQFNLTDWHSSWSHVSARLFVCVSRGEPTQQSTNFCNPIENILSHTSQLDSNKNENTRKVCAAAISNRKRLAQERYFYL